MLLLSLHSKRFSLVHGFEQVYYQGMSELAPPLSRTRRGAARLEAVERLTAQSAQLLSLARLEMNALLTEDTAPGDAGLSR